MTGDFCGGRAIHRCYWKNGKNTCGGVREGTLLITLGLFYKAVGSHFTYYLK